MVRSHPALTETLLVTCPFLSPLPAVLVVGEVELELPLPSWNQQPAMGPAWRVEKTSEQREHM